MSRDFIGSMEGRVFRQSPNRDRIVRRGIGFLSAREIIGYVYAFAGGIFGRENPSITERRFFSHASFTFTVSDVPEVLATQEWQIDSQLRGSSSTEFVGFPNTANGSVNIYLNVSADIFGQGVASDITVTSGNVNRGTRRIHWQLSDEIDLSARYEELRSMLNSLPFPQSPSTNPFITGVGSTDTLNSFSLNSTTPQEFNFPNVDAMGSVLISNLGLGNPFGPHTQWRLFPHTSGTTLLGADVGIQVVSIRIRDVLVGGASKVWQFANADGWNPLSPLHQVISETSCTIGSPGSILGAPEFSTLQPSRIYKAQSRIAFPAHKWTVPTSFGGRVAAFTGLPPSCAPEIVGTEP